MDVEEAKHDRIHFISCFVVQNNAPRARMTLEEGKYDRVNFICIRFVVQNDAAHARMKLEEAKYDRANFISTCVRLLPVVVVSI